MKESILIISPFFNPNIGGVETHLNDLCNYLIKSNYNVVVLTYQPLITKIKAPKVEKNEHLTIYRVNWFGHNLFNKLERIPLIQFLYLTPGLFCKTFVFLMKHHNEINVIHSHGLIASFISGFWGRIFSKHTVVSLHTMYRLANRPLLAPIVKFILKMNNRILVLSKEGKQDLEYIGLDGYKIDVYTYWIDQNKFSLKDKNKCRRKRDLPENKFIVLFVGRFVEQKGVKLVCEAIKFCGNDTLFLFIGEGPDEIFIKELSKLRENVKLVGKVNNKEMPDYYGSSDILAWGSIDAGYLGRVCVESISCGLPLIAPNQCIYFSIPREVTTQDLNPDIGILIEPKPYTLARTIEFFKDNPAELKKLAANTIKYAQKRYSENNAKKITQVYSMK